MSKENETWKVLPPVHKKSCRLWEITTRMHNFYGPDEVVLATNGITKIKLYWWWRKKWITVILDTNNPGHSNPLDKSGELLSWVDDVHSYVLPLVYSLHLGCSASDGGQAGRVGVLVPLPPPPRPVQDILLPMMNDEVFTNYTV